MPERNYGYVCGSVANLLAKDGTTTLFEKIAGEMGLKKNPEHNLHQGIQAGDEFIMHDVSREGESRIVYVAVTEGRFNDFLTRVDKASGGQLLHNDTKSPLVTSDGIEELPVVQLKCASEPPESFANRIRSNVLDQMS